MIIKRLIHPKHVLLKKKKKLKSKDDVETEDGKKEKRSELQIIVHCCRHKLVQNSNAINIFKIYIFRQLHANTSNNFQK